jgi:hypothetical protein
MPSTYQLISSNVLSSSAASVTFSAIPSTFTDFVIRASIRSDNSIRISDAINIRINSDIGANYSWVYVLGNGSSASSSINNGIDYVSPGVANAPLSTSNTFASLEMYVPNYTTSAKKPLSFFGAFEDNTTTAQVRATAGLWQGTAAITSVQFFPLNGPNFVSGSSFYLYGIKNS